MSAFSLRPTNKELSSKKEDVVRASFRKFTTLLDNGLELISISVS